MEHPRILAVICLAACAGPALAQSAASKANEQRCAALQQEVQASYQAAVQARVPKQDPASFNQDAYDIKGIMSQDVGSSYGKLLNLNFGAVIDKLVNGIMQSATQRGQQQYSANMNSVLQAAGVPPLTYQGAMTGPALMNTFVSTQSTAANVQKPAAAGTTSQSASPYSRSR